MVQFCRYLNISESQKCLLHLSAGSHDQMQHPDWFVKCCCLQIYDSGHVFLMIMFVHFLTNACQLFITNGLKRLFICLTLGFIIKNLLCLFAIVLPENPLQLKTNEFTKGICSQVAHAHI